MKKVYLSHGSADQLVGEVRDALNNFQIAVSSGQDVVEQGSSWLEGIVSAIRDSAGVVVFPTRKGNSVQFEAGVAVGANKPILVIRSEFEIPSTLSGFLSISGYLSSLEIAREIRSWLESVPIQRKEETLTQNANLRDLDKHEFQGMSSADLEGLILKALQEAGINAKEGERYFDIWAILEGKEFAIEVKNTLRGAPVSTANIDRILGQRLRHARGFTWLLVSPAGFTRAASTVARKHGIRLAGIEELLALAEGNAHMFLAGRDAK